MKPPQPGYGKDHAVKWLNVGSEETMYTGAMTENQANYVLRMGHWNPNAKPVVVKLERKPREVSE